jgi:hypothetical protein
MYKEEETGSFEKTCKLHSRKPERNIKVTFVFEAQHVTKSRHWTRSRANSIQLSSSQLIALSSTEMLRILPSVSVFGYRFPTSFPIKITYTYVYRMS